MSIMKKIKSKLMKPKEAALSAFQQLQIMKAALAAAILGLSIQANAAVPDAVKTSIEGSKTDGLEVGWIVVGVIAALFVIKIVKGLIR